MGIKKALAVACVVGIMASFTACGNKDDNKDKGDTGTSAATTSRDETDNGNIVTTAEDMIDNVITTISDAADDIAGEMTTASSNGNTTEATTK